MKTVADIPILSRSRPVIGHQFEMINERVGFIEHIAAEQQPIVRAQAIVGEVLVVSDPDLAKAVLSDTSRSYQKTYLTKFVGAPLAGEGLFLSEDELWKRQRHLVAPLFHQDFLERYSSEMVTCINSTLAGYASGARLSVPQAMTDVTMRIAMKTLFGTDVTGETHELGEAITHTLEWAASNAPSAYALIHVFARRLFEYGARQTSGKVALKLQQASNAFKAPRLLVGQRGAELKRALGILDTKMYSMIDHRTKLLSSGATVPDDILTKMLLLKSDDGTSLQPKEVRDELLTLFGAAHETTAAALSWAVQLLCENPDAYQRVVDEVAGLSEAPSYRVLNRLDYTRRVFKEALRLYPPLYLLGRQTRKAVQLGDYALPESTALTVCVFALHRNQAIWPAPERFDPDRFLPEHESKRSRYAWLPFGTGPRVCLGAQFALIEGTLLLASLLRAFDLKLESRAHMQPAMSLRPSSDLVVTLTRRAT